MSSRSFTEQIFYFDIFFFCKVLRNLIARVQYCNAICGMEFSKNGKKMFKSSVFINFLKVVSMFKKRCVATSLNWAFFSEFSLQIFLWTFLDNREYNAISFILSCFSAKLFQFTMKSDLESSSCNNKIKGLSL